MAVFLKDKCGNDEAVAEDVYLKFLLGPLHNLSFWDVETLEAVSRPLSAFNKSYSHPRDVPAKPKRFSFLTLPLLKACNATSAPIEEKYLFPGLCVNLANKSRKQS